MSGRCDQCSEVGADMYCWSCAVRAGVSVEKLESDLAAARERVWRLADALEEAANGLACAYDCFDHFRSERCCPTKEEVSSCLSYWHDAKEALKAEREGEK